MAVRLVPSSGIVGFLLFQQSHRLCKRQAGWHFLKIRKDFAGDDHQAFEKQYSSLKIQLHSGDFPCILGNLSLLYLKFSTLIETTKESPTEADIPVQGAIDFRDAVLVGIDEYHSMHSGKYLLDPSGRLVSGVRLELQADQRISPKSDPVGSLSHPVILVGKSIGHGPHDARNAVTIIALLLLLALQLAWVVGQVVEPIGLGLPLGRVELSVIDCHQHANSGLLTPNIEVSL